MAEETTTETQPTASGNEAESGAERIAALEAEVTGLKDRMLRTLAEMENLRRRTEREMADARQYAVANFARDMLNVGDNLRRALEAVPKELRNHPDPALAGLIEGVEVTERGLAQTLQKFGVRLIEAKGQKFDPTRHQAMFEVEDASVPAGMVVEVVQPGYVIGERVLRPALVGVSKGGPKQASATPGNDNDAEASKEAQAADDPTG